MRLFFLLFYMLFNHTLVARAKDIGGCRKISPPSLIAAVFENSPGVIFSRSFIFTRHLKEPAKLAVMVFHLLSAVAVVVLALQALSNAVKVVQKDIYSIQKPSGRRSVGMRKSKEVETSNSQKKMRPALTPEAHENQMISLAMDLVETRLREGTATSQETVHFLRLASSKARIEKEILEKQKDLIAAKTESLQAAKRIEELYTNALDAMRSYSGHGGSDDEY